MRKNPIRCKAARYREEERYRDAARARNQLLLYRPSKCRKKSPLYALRPGVNFLLRPNRTVVVLSLYAPPRRKRGLGIRGLLPSGYTARDLVRDVLVPSRRLLLS